MKIFAAFLGLGFLFFPFVGSAQDDFSVQANLRALQGDVLELEMKLKDQQEKIQNLEKRCKDLNEALKDARGDIDSLRTSADRVDDESIGSPLYRMKTDLIALGTKLAETEDRLTTAEFEIQELGSGPRKHPVIQKPSVSRPKTPVDNPEPAPQGGTH